MFVGRTAEGVDGPEGGIDDAQDCGEGIFGQSGVGGIGESPLEQALCYAGGEFVGNSAGWGLAYGGWHARRVFPDDAGLWIGPDEAQILAAVIEEFEITIEVVGHQESAHRRGGVVSLFLRSIGRHVTEPQAGGRCVTRRKREQLRTSGSFERLRFEELGGVDDGGVAGTSE